MVKKIALSEIKPGFSFRKEFHIEDLKENMRQYGLIVPIAVCPESDGKFIVVCGERRRRAAIELGWKEIDCSIRHYDSVTERIAAGIFENLKRDTYSRKEERKSLSHIAKLKRKAKAEKSNAKTI